MIRHQADELKMLSTLNLKGQRIPIHRSIHRLSFPLSRLGVVLFLPLAFNIAIWGMHQPIGASWAAFFEFWIDKLDLNGTVTLKSSSFGWLDIALPYLAFPTRAPDITTWWITLAGTITVWLFTALTPERFLPLRYFLWSVAFIQISALMFFALFPDAFPTTVTNYIASSLVTGVWLIFLIPWLHALIYYIFDFRLLQKAWFTLLTISFIIIILPFQLMMHSYLLVKFSLLFLPVFYLLFGLLLQIFACIALYGWAMSWQHD